ncbi:MULTISPECIES: hypothetical protein [Streptosporangium]|uniref:Uncharacterized protein n=1 Tax=Streptosporangium brasiliense TaxID=47480 RepID=A0ABT9RIQ0_9ACTN|nr:hypothetical protein [Streptosporangium brasiliense]MDP9869169.1 hypothetical protein [Streptosporangium brasiliense]
MAPAPRGPPPLSAGKALTVRVAADAFLGSLDSPNTPRSYAIGVGRTAERLGEVRSPALNVNLFAEDPY